MLKFVIIMSGDSFMIKIYKNGEEFIEDNKDLINNYEDRLQMFYANALKYFKPQSEKKFLFGKINEYNKELLFCLVDNLPLLLFSIDFTKKMIEDLYYYFKSNKIIFTDLITSEELALKWIEVYEGKEKIFFSKENELYLLSLKSLNLHTTFDTDFRYAEEKDFEVLLKMFQDYDLEIHGRAKHQHEDAIKNNIKQKTLFVLVNNNNEIVSMANTSRVLNQTFSINHVYTKPEFREKGYGKAIISELIMHKFEDGYQNASCFVRVNNEYYKKFFKCLGFNIVTTAFKYHVIKNLESAIFAGGCFWCMARPFHEFDGVCHVISGYTGGKTKNPTYNEVKSHKSGHREAIKINFNPQLISYKQLLEIYFYSIDPFDAGGQFADRGAAYKTAIFYVNKEQKKEALDFINNLEKIFKKKVATQVLPFEYFYVAEAKHQDFHIKNPLEYSLEIESSGREHRIYEFYFEHKDKCYKACMDKDTIIDIKEVDKIAIFNNPNCAKPLIAKITRYLKTHPESNINDIKKYLKIE